MRLKRKSLEPVEERKRVKGKKVERLEEKLRAGWGQKGTARDDKEDKGIEMNSSG